MVQKDARDVLCWQSSSSIKKGHSQIHHLEEWVQTEMRKIANVAQGHHISCREILPRGDEVVKESIVLK